MDFILCLIYFIFLVVAILYAWAGGIATKCMDKYPTYATENPNDKLYIQNTLPIVGSVIGTLIMCGSIQVYLSSKK